MTGLNGITRNHFYSNLSVKAITKGERERERERERGLLPNELNGYFRSQ